MKIEKYLPLSESTYYILLALREPMHGYAIMQKVEVMSEGLVTIGPGTLYGAFTTLESGGLIEQHKKEGRRKFYRLTRKGEAVLSAQLERLQMMVKNGKQSMDETGS